MFETSRVIYRLSCITQPLTFRNKWLLLAADLGALFHTSWLTLPSWSTAAHVSVAVYMSSPTIFTSFIQLKGAQWFNIVLL